MRRSIVAGGCKIGKNADIVNSIILEKVEIEDNCKIIDSVVGGSAYIREQSNINSCQLAPNCHVYRQTTLEGEIVLPLNTKH